MTHAEALKKAKDAQRYADLVDPDHIGRADDCSNLLDDVIAHLESLPPARKPKRNR